MSFGKLDNGTLTSPRRYNTGSDARMRLRHTIVLYKGFPVYVEDIAHSESLDIIVTDTLGLLGNKCAAYTVDSSSNLLDISSPRIGWINYRDRPMFVMRTPQNSQKQGLCPYNLSAFNLAKGKVDRGPGGPPPYRYEGQHELVPLMKAIYGMFPTFRDALKEPLGAAINLEWAVSPLSDKYSALFHHTHPVALIDKTSKRILFGRHHTTKTQTQGISSILYSQGVDYSVQTLS